ncbi:hypothetical protein COLO4_34075 [Corchorus olitorius]|uniref:Uncharacterized protein n=1 Tax=Corchorus olitorius TaxID=93759 RepID=A0A1R3GNR4_9ROSI|nr:hypothetical protein COLO4_34075 [Corchorus olitorius]
MADSISISIDEMLRSFKKTSTKPCISKVANYLRRVNGQAYDLKVIAIGPYHRGKDHLEAMEDRKIQFLQELLEEKNETDVSRYVLKLREIEERARNCYAEPVSLNSDDLVKMLLLDGCFIVQFIRLLFIMIESADRPYFSFLATIFLMFRSYMPGKGSPIEDFKLTGSEEIMHLLDFNYHYCCHPSTSETEANGKKQNFDFDWSFIRCATELQEAGIKFRRVDGNTMFDISFKDGTLYIPQLKIADRTEYVLRNLIAFEQLFLSNNFVKHVTDYMVFIDNLVESPKDVELLCRNGIFNNFLGDAAAAATMINGLGNSVIVSTNFYYNDTFSKVNQHCSKQWNRRMANLKHNYFNSPWALISVMAATLLLILTVVQTIFSVLSYAK